MIFTFYSFKGGVGRSMSMATVAYLMAQRGLKVLTIDFDLEAPGLERYFFDEPTQLAEVRSNPGLLDLVLAYKRALTSEVEFQRAEFKKWRSFVVDAIPRTPQGGSVDLMTSGRRHPESRLTEYALAVRGFDWQDFFHNWRGDRFFEWFRQQLTAESDGYKIVLVDSRTGVTEMGGICAYQLADAAVLMCAPNYQNLDGTRAVVSDFRSAAVLALRSGRPLELLVLPARVEQSDQVKRDRFFADLERTFGTEGLPKALADAGLTYRSLAVPYRPELAVIERLVDETAAGSSGALVAKSEARTAYETLTDALMLMTSGPRWAPHRQQALKRLAGASASVDTIADVTQRAAGYDAFIESRQQDRDRVAPLVEMLRHQGLTLWWPGDQGATDLAPEAQKRAIDYSHALVLCAGSDAPSQWSMATLAAFQKRQKPIVVVLLPGLENAAPWLRLHEAAETNAIDLRGGVAEGVAVTRLLDLIRHDRPMEAQAPVETVRPYPGPAAFDEEDAPFFHEREAETAALHEAFAEHHVVLLEGGSGVGKTSLARAGLLPRIRRGEGAFASSTARTYIVVSIDAAEASEEHWHQLERGNGDSPVLWVLDSIDSFPLDGTPPVRERRLRRILDVVGRADDAHRVLLMWRGSLGDERQMWLDALTAAAGTRFVVVTLEPLTPSALRAVIEKPAGAAGHLLEPGLADRLLRDAGATHEQTGGKASSPGVVAQIQGALAEIWSKRTRGWLTNKAYDEAGGIAGQFNARLQSALDGAGLDSETPARVLLRRLLQFDAQFQVRREFRHWDTLVSIPAVGARDPLALRDTLARARIVDVWLDEGRLSCALAQPAPGTMLESLARASAPFMLWQQRFASYVHAYVNSGRAATAVVVGDPLAEAMPWRNSHADQLSSDERQLIDASIAVERQREAAELERQRVENERLTAARDRAESERQRAEHIARRNARLARVTAAVTIVAVIIAGFAWLQRNQVRLQGDEIAQQAALLGARRLAAADPTAALVGLVGAVDRQLSQEAVLRVLSFLPDGPLTRARVAHDAPITDAAFLSDQRVVSAGGDAIRFWNLDGQVYAAERIDSPVVALVATKPGERGAPLVLAALSSGTILTFTPDGRRSNQVSINDRIPFGASFSPDGRLLAVPLETGGLRVFTAEGREVWAVSAQGTGAVSDALFDPSATTLLTIEPRGLRLWDAASGQLRRQVAFAGLAPTTARFSPKGDRVATAVEDGSLRVWDVASGAVHTLGEPSVLRGYAVVEPHVAFSADGTLLASCFEEPVVRIWNTKGTMVGVLRSDVEFTGIQFSPSSPHHVLTTSPDGLATVWALSSDRIEPQLLQADIAAQLRGHTSPLLFALFDDSGSRVLTASRDQTARLWNWSERLALQVQIDRQISDLAIGRDNQTAVLGLDDGRVLLWRFDSGQLAPLQRHTDGIQQVVLSPTGERVATASLESVRLTALADGTSVALAARGGFIVDVAFSADGQRLVTGSSEGAADVWSVRGDAIATLHHGGAVTRVEFSPDGRAVLTASADATARLWNAATGQATAVLKHAGKVNVAGFSPRGDRILTVAEGDGLRVWSADGKAAQTLPGAAADDRVLDAVFSPDGTKVVATLTGRVLLWPSVGTQPIEFATGEEVTRAEWASNDLLVTASLNGEASLWRVDGRRVAAVAPGTDALTRATLTSNGRYLVTASIDGAARAWPVSPEGFRTRLANTAFPCLAAREWEDFFLVDPAEAQARSISCATGSRGGPF